jgi:hypothetical protein
LAEGLGVVSEDLVEEGAHLVVVRIYGLDGHDLVFGDGCVGGQGMPTGRWGGGRGAVGGEVGEAEALGDQDGGGVTSGVAVEDGAAVVAW